MKHACWDVQHNHSFLLPNPIAALDLDLTADLEEVAADLPYLLRSGQLRTTLAQFPALDLTPLADHPDERVIERLMQIYSFWRMRMFTPILINPPARSLRESRSRSIN